MENSVIKILSDELCRSRLKNPSYSLRAFSHRIGVQASALSEIMNGKRDVTLKMGCRILQGLCYSPEEIDTILSKKTSTSIYSPNLSLEYFKVISDWYYFAILSLAEIPQFRADAEWIAKRLNISKKTSSMALERLIKLELLVKLKSGLYKAKSIKYKTPTDVKNISLKKHTLQTLELAKESLFETPLGLRDFSTITMSIDISRVGEAKKEISKFRKKISKLLESGQKKEVYKLAIQLFPLTKKIKGS